ncbi:MAG: ABC transporter substrate-binding protein [Acidobacteria bacterium]|jgi:iron complex transport system substrate-binding protein|nr:ABC transporter substrate-binding protein [Acidobacteriota bacterium]
MACDKAPQPPHPSSPTAISVTDFRGETITLEKPAKRVVCLIESALSSIFMLQAQDTLYGVPTVVYYGNVAQQYAILDERIKRKLISAPGNWDFFNIETVLSLEPDLVIIWASQTEAIASMEKHGIPIYAVMIKNLEDVYKEISDLGILLDKTERANTLIDFTRNEMNRFTSYLRSIVSAEPRKVYFMWAQSLLDTSGKKSVVNQVINAALGVNVCQAEWEHIVVNRENLLLWNPEIIIMWQNDRLDPVDVINEPGFQTLNAVRNKRVYELPSVFYGDLWTLKFQYVIKLIARWLWPEELATLNLEEEKKKMLVFLYGQNAGRMEAE